MSILLNSIHGLPDQFQPKAIRERETIIRESGIQEARDQ